MYSQKKMFALVDVTTETKSVLAQFEAIDKPAMLSNVCYEVLYQNLPGAAGSFFVQEVTPGVFEVHCSRKQKPVRTFKLYAKSE